MRNERLLAEQLKYRYLVEFMDWKYPAGWSVTYTAWDKQLICHITIGCTRSATGAYECEAFLMAAFMFKELRNWLVEYDERNGIA